jgi:hypothetical protein
MMMMRERKNIRYDYGGKGLGYYRLEHTRKRK